MFTAVVAEATKTAFKIALDNLKLTVFSPDTTVVNSQVPLHTPALASLLPAMKTISSKFLPLSSASNYVKDIIGGPYLDALCTAVFDCELSSGGSGGSGGDMMWSDYKSVTDGGSLLGGLRPGV